MRSKKSKDSAELCTHAGPAYDDLPMSPRLPISVPTIIPPSQQNERGDSTQGRYYGGNEYFDGDESSDAYSVTSEPKNGNGYGHYHGSSKGGSISAASLGGVSGPRPLPPRSGSAEKMYEGAKYNTLGQLDSPSVRYSFEIILIVETSQETSVFGSWINTVSHVKYIRYIKSHKQSNVTSPTRGGKREVQFLAIRANEKK